MRKKTILITGISSGFGKDATLKLLMRGHTVLGALRGGVERWKTIAPETLPLLKSGQLRIFDVHLEKPEGVDLLVRAVTEHLDGKLDVLVNNAGYGLYGSLDMAKEDQLRHQMEVNFFAPTLLAKKLYPALKKARGRIINISSIMGVMTFPFSAAYNASKYALEAMSEGMAYDWEPDGIQVGLIEPGSFKTSFLSSGIKLGAEADDPSHPKHAASQKFKAQYKSKEQFSGNPEKVANLIVKYCECNRLPLRTLIGSDAIAMAFIKWLLPEKLRFLLVSAGYKKMFQR